MSRKKRDWSAGARCRQPGLILPQKPVRVSGWLMLDPDHRNHLGKFRNTLWEIHPITKFEVFKDGAFVDLDKLP